MFRHVANSFLATIEDLGGIKGIAILCVCMFFFVLIVQNTVSHRHSYNSNYNRLRTAPVRKRK